MIKKSELIERFEKIHNYRYNYEYIDYLGMHKKIKISCSIHGIFEQTPNIHLSGSGCPICNSVKISKDNFLIRCKEKHKDFYDYSQINFTIVSEKIKIICPLHGEFEQRASNHLDGQKCPYCSNKKIKNEDFIKKANEIHENKYDYSFVEYKNAVSKIKIICPSHGEFIQIAKNHIYLNEGCPYCSKNKSNLELFLKNAKIKHNNKYDYSNFTNYTNNKEKIKIICPTHGEFFQIIYNHLSGAGCPKCTETKGESLIRTYLEKNNVKFEQYKRFENCRYKNTLAYDFYLPDHNICIEYDGKQHYEPIDWFGGKKKLKYTIMVDKIKNDYCIKNNIKLFRIKYDENVLDKISSFIIKYL